MALIRLHKGYAPPVAENYEGIFLDELKPVNRRPVTDLFNYLADKGLDVFFNWQLPRASFIYLTAVSDSPARFEMTARDLISQANSRNEIYHLNGLVHNVTILTRRERFSRDTLPTRDEELINTSQNERFRIQYKVTDLLGFRRKKATPIELTLTTKQPRG